MRENNFSEKIALYFYFSCLDESKAQASTIHALKSVRQETSTKKTDGNLQDSINLVRITSQLSGKARNATKPTNLAFSTGHIILPANSNWGPWFEFRKTASDKDFSAVLYAKVLNISDEDIAEGLGLPLGTVRYRISRGLKLLGRICLQGTGHAEP